jgi:hypothetical protein
MICSVCRKAEAVGYEYISHPDEPPRALCGACELVLQLAAEFGRSITDQDISADEIKYLLKAAESERVNPNHYPPAKWAASFFVFLRQTGNFPEMLESPHKFAREIIRELNR